MRETEFLVELLLHVVIRVPLTRDIRKELTFLVVFLRALPHPFSDLHIFQASPSIGLLWTATRCPTPCNMQPEKITFRRPCHQFFLD